MRKLVVILLALLAVIGAAAAYLIVTTPKSAQPLRFPLTDSHRQLLSRVPASADTFALIPSAALLHGKLLANPVTRDPVLKWTHEHELPRPWMLGGADLAVWKSGKVTSYAVRLDSFRALFVRAWLLMSSNADARWDGSTLIMHEAAPAAPASLDDVLRLAAALPEGDLLVVQREGGRGAFPPIARPAVTSVRVAPSEITLVSRAASDDTAQQREIRPRFPRGAMLSAAFAAPPRILGDFDRLMNADLNRIVAEGGSIALYDFDDGTFIPRPKGVIAVPANEQSRQQMRSLETVAALVGETRDTGEQLLVSFDRSSMGLYLKDATEPATWPATQWAVRIAPQRLVPVLRRAGDSTGLRIVAPRVHRAARDLRRWIDVLNHADTVEAAASVAGGVEELRVRVSSK